MEIEFDRTKPKKFKIQFTIDLAIQGGVQVIRKEVEIPAKTIAEAFELFPKIFADFKREEFARHGLDENGKRPHPEMLPNRSERRAKRH